MTPAQFQSLLSRTRMREQDRTAQVCRLVLVDGMTAYAACKQVGLSQSAASVALARLRQHVGSS